LPHKEAGSGVAGALSHPTMVPVRKLMEAMNLVGAQPPT